jgi:uncharacterized protein (DUF983 family)
MAMEGGFCSETCSHCGELNTFPGFSSMEAYTCRHCGVGVLVQRPVAMTALGSPAREQFG